MKRVIFPNKIERENNNKNIVAVLGKLETMHKGHLELISSARELANGMDAELMVMIFSQRNKNNFYTIEERIMFANKYKPDYYLEFEPNSKNKSIEWLDFNKYLLEQGVSHIVCGHDFEYGFGRKGNIETLDRDFHVHSHNEITDGDRPLRTTELMKCVNENDLVAFKNIMGHYFFYEGEVIKGKQLGRELGMPTINVKYPEHKISLNEGIYYSYVIYNGQRLPSLTSISSNPSIDDGDNIKYETYIYNFNEELYGETVFVEIVEWFREPAKVESLEELKTILENDKKLGVEYFKIR